MVRESKEEKRRATARAVVTRIEEETSQCADPLEFMLRIMADDTQPYESRVECAKAAVAYVHPKLASVQHTGADGAPLEQKVIHTLMMDPRAAELAEQLSLSLVRKTNELEAINPLTTINLVAQPSAGADQPEVFSLDPRPANDIEAAFDERLSPEPAA